MTPHLYVHIPYCNVICPYCDFLCDLPKNLPPASRYVDALIRDLDARAGRFETVYFGGGTPTELPLEDFKRLLSAVRPRLSEGGEWTIEANPRSLTKEMIESMADAGVNRVSLGTQSTNDEVLKRLGRVHRHADTRRTIADLNLAGIKNISADVIFGLDDEKLGATIDELATEPITHISTYELTIEGESFWSLKKIDPSVDSEVKQEKTELIVARLAEHGYRRYEISNYARDGFRARHNLNVWKCGEFAAIGAGAHGYEDGQRYMMTESIAEYVENSVRIEDDAENLFVDTILCVMRLVDGVRFEELPDRHRKCLERETARMDQLREEGYIEISADIIRSTAKGLRYLNEAALIVA